MRRNRIWVVAAATCALLVGGPVLWLASADNRPDPQLPNVNNVVSSDQATGGILPSLPVPVNPVPGGLPGVPTSLDPESTSDVGADGEPVTVNLKGNGVTGKLVFTGRQVRGTATGLNPSKRYVSLLYGNLSTARPGEVLTCADVRTAAGVKSWSISGEWDVAADGSATLTGTASRDLADGVYTVSIRRVGGVQGSDPLTAFTPVTSPVVACAPVPGA